MEIKEFDEGKIAGLLSDYVKIDQQHDALKRRIDIIKKSFTESPRDVLKRDKDYTILSNGRCFVFSIKESLRSTIDSKLLEKELVSLGVDVRPFRKESIVTRFTASESRIITISHT